MADQQTRRFVAGLSFAGEERDFVRSVAEELRGDFDRKRILYDDWHKGPLTRVDLDVLLPDLYLKECQVCVVFLSKRYLEKGWTGLEWTHIRQHIRAEPARIFLVRLDETDVADVPGLTSGVGCFDAREGTPKVAHDVSAAIYERILEIDPSAADTPENTHDATHTSPPASDSGAPRQAGFDTANADAFSRRLVAELAELLQLELMLRFRPPLGEQLGLAQEADGRALAVALVEVAPVDALKAWTRTCQQVKRKLHGKPTWPDLWPLVEQVALLLLPRLVSPAWLQQFEQRQGGWGDKRLLELSIQYQDSGPRGSNPLVQVLMARVDPDHGDLRFGPAEGQLEARNLNIQDVSAPTPDAVVQRIAMYLWDTHNSAEQNVDTSPMTQLTTEQFEELDALLELLPEPPKPYLVAHCDERLVVNKAVMGRLFQLLPHLPRVILSDPTGGDPFEGQQHKLTGYLTAFWKLTP